MPIAAGRQPNAQFDATVDVATSASNPSNITASAVMTGDPNSANNGQPEHSGPKTDLTVDVSHADSLVNGWFPCTVGVTNAGDAVTVGGSSVAVTLHPIPLQPKPVKQLDHRRRRITTSTARGRRGYGSSTRRSPWKPSMRTTDRNRTVSAGESNRVMSAPLVASAPMTTDGSRLPTDLAADVLRHYGRRSGAGHLLVTNGQSSMRP